MDAESVSEAQQIEQRMFDAKVQTGEVVSIAGEGLGAEPGKVMIFVSELELEGEVQGWFDLGVLVKMPALPIAKETSIEVVVVREDGVATNALPLTLAPGKE